MAVKIIKESDGLRVTHVPTVDFTDPHPGDIAAMKQMILDCAPESLIQNLEAFADAADLTDPLIAIRITQLREQIAYARRMAVDGSYDPALIDRADRTRREILTLPLAVAGLKSKDGHCSRDDYADKQEVIERVRGTPSPPTTLTAWLQLPAIAPYAKKYKGATLRKWIKEAVPNTLKTGRPKKT